MGDEPDDTHPLAATTEERIDLVDAADEARPRFPAGRKPGPVGSRRIGRLVLRRDLDEDLAPKCDSAVGVRVGAAAAVLVLGLAPRSVLAFAERSILSLLM
jgi:hypothetical protein